MPDMICQLCHRGILPSEPCEGDSANGYFHIPCEFGAGGRVHETPAAPVKPCPPLTPPPSLSGFRLDQLLDTREAAYGKLDEAFADVEKIMTILYSPLYLPGERVMIEQAVLKLVRHKHSPQNPDHLFDARGYLTLAQRRRHGKV